MSKIEIRIFNVSFGFLKPTTTTINNILITSGTLAATLVTHVEAPVTHFLTGIKEQRRICFLALQLVWCS